MERISYEHFAALNIRIGEILSVEKVPDTDKLLRLMVDVGEEEPRQIVSGIAEYFENLEDLVGKKCPFLLNLEPRTIRGVESNGMILAVSAEEGKFALLEPHVDMPKGSTIR